MSEDRLNEIKAAAKRYTDGHPLTEADMKVMLSPRTVAELVAEVVRLSDGITEWAESLDDDARLGIRLIGRRRAAVELRTIRDEEPA